LNIKKKKQLRT